MAESDLVDCKISFHKGRSTSDIALEIRDFMMSACNQKKYGNLVSLNFKNVFDSIR